MNRAALSRLRKLRLAVSYARFSTDKQESTAEQFGINEDIAEDEGIQVVQHFKDEGVSRSVADRPGLLAMFAHLEVHPEVGYIVVNELERLTSGIAQRTEIARLCQRLHITIITEDMGAIDPFDEMKMHEADQRSVTSKGEVLKVARRTRRNLRKKVQAGRMAFRPPYGVRMKPLVLADGTALPSGVPMMGSDGKKVRSGEIELHPDEHPWLMQIFEWAHAGRSSDAIAKALTAADVPTKTGKGAWRGNTINGILDNPFYKGEWVWGRTRTVRAEGERARLEDREEDDPGRVVMPSPLGAIVDPVTWDAIHKARLERRQQAYKTRQVRQRQVLDGLVWCAHCGHRMYGRYDNPNSRKNLSWRYYCYSSRTGYTPQDGFGPTCATTHSMSLKAVLAALAGMSKQGAQVTVVANPTSVDDLGIRRRRLEADIAAAQKEYGRAQDLTVKGLMTDAELMVRKDDRDQAVTEAEAALAALDAAPKAKILPFSGPVAETFRLLSELLADETVTLADRTEALRSAGVERIYLDSPDVRLHLRD